MRPNAQRLRELRAGRNVRDIAAACGVDWRTILLFESGDGTDRFQYNTINQLAAWYGVAIEEIIEEIPADLTSAQLRRRIVHPTAATPA